MTLRLTPGTSFQNMTILSVRRENETKYLYGADCIIVEGIYVLLDEKLRDLFDLKLFVDTADDIRLARRRTFSLFNIALSNVLS